jgi:hypothetical protein
VVQGKSGLFSWTRRYQKNKSLLYSSSVKCTAWERPYHVQVPTIGTRSFLKVVKKFKTQLSAGKIMISVLGFKRSDSCWFPFALCHNYAQYYSDLLRNDVHQAVWKKRPRKLCKKVTWQRSSRYSKSDEGDTSNNGLGNHEPPSLQPLQPPSDFHLFGAMKVHPGRQTFKTDDEPKSGGCSELPTQWG